MNKEFYNKNYDFNVNKYTPKLFRHFTPAAQEWFNSIYAYDHNYIKSLPVADKHLRNTSLKLSFKILFIKKVIEGIFLLLFVLHILSLDINALLILIYSMMTAKLISELNASLNSYEFKNEFLNKLISYLKILNFIINKYLTIKRLWPLITLIYILFNSPYFVILLILTSITILIYINYINIKFKDNYKKLYIFINFLCISILMYCIINQYIVYVWPSNNGSANNSGYGGWDSKSPNSPKPPKPPRSEATAWFKKNRIPERIKDLLAERST